MAIVRLDPFRDIWSMSDAVDRMMCTSVWTDRELLDRGWAPACDIHETNSNVIVECELPGVEAKDIDVNIEGDTLTITGERMMSSEVNDQDYHRIERSYGSFTRVLALPSEVNADKVNAAYDKGVVKITMPKLQLEKPKTKKITIKEKTTAK
jgi:HSP20 family protein